MKLSVIIPTYNNEETLEQTVRSVLAQDHENFELIVVNDGGRSPAEFLTISDPRLRILDETVNRGVSGARNLGFQETDGELVYFLDADDLVFPDFFSYAQSVFKDPSVSILVALHETVREDRIRHDHSLEIPERSSNLEVMRSSDFLKLMRGRPAAVLPSGTIFRRTALLDTLGDEPWSTSFKIAQDALMIMLMAWKHDIHLSADKYYIYRVRPDSLSGDRIATLQERIQVMDVFTDTVERSRGDRSLIGIALQMRQNGARRLAQLLKQDNKHAEARKVLVEDIRRSFNWKSAAALLIPTKLR